MAVMPLSTLVLSYLLLGESFEWVHLIGFAGLLLVIRSHQEMSDDDKE